MIRPRRRHRGGVAPALVALVLWLLGVELGPGLHQALHRYLAPHHHHADDVASQGGSVVQVHLGRAHHHAPDGSDVDGPPPTDEPDGRAVTDRLRHGRHSLAHRGVAMAPPAPPALAPMVVWQVTSARPPDHADIAITAPAPVSSARAPPA